MCKLMFMKQHINYEILYHILKIHNVLPFKS